MGWYSNEEIFSPSVSLGNNPAGEICLQLWLTSNRAIWGNSVCWCWRAACAFTHSLTIRRMRHKIDSKPAECRVYAIRYSDGSGGGKRFHFISMRIWLASAELPLFQLIMRWAFFSRRNLCVSRFFSFLSLSDRVDQYAKHEHPAIHS